MKKNRVYLAFLILTGICFGLSNSSYSKELLDRYIQQMEQFTPPEVDKELLKDLLKQRYESDDLKVLLEKGLNDEEGAIRKACAIYVVKNKLKEFSRILVDKIEKTADITEKKLLIWAFGEIGNADDILAMVEYLRNEENPYVLNLLAAAISKLARESENITPLILLTEHSKSFYIKSTAIIGMGKIGNVDAIPVILKQAFGNTSKEVRFCAIIALSELLSKKKNFTEELQRMKNQYSNAESIYEKMALAYAIQKVGGFDEMLYSFLVGYLKTTYYDELAIDFLENLHYKQGSDRLEIIMTNYPRNMIKTRISSLVVQLKAIKK